MFKFFLDQLITLLKTFEQLKRTWALTSLTGKWMRLSRILHLVDITHSFFLILCVRLTWAEQINICWLGSFITNRFVIFYQLLFCSYVITVLWIYKVKLFFCLLIFAFAFALPLNLIVFTVTLPPWVQEARQVQNIIRLII